MENNIDVDKILENLSHKKDLDSVLKRENLPKEEIKNVKLLFENTKIFPLIKYYSYSSDNYKKCCFDAYSLSQTLNVSRKDVENKLNSIGSKFEKDFIQNCLLSFAQKDNKLIANNQGEHILLVLDLECIQGIYPENFVADKNECKVIFFNELDGRSTYIRSNFAYFLETGAVKAITGISLDVLPSIEEIKELIGNKHPKNIRILADYKLFNKLKRTYNVDLEFPEFKFIAIS